MRMLNWILASLGCVAWTASAQTAAINITNGVIPVRPAKVKHPLAFDSETKEYTAKASELSVHFTFNVTNTSAQDVIITGTQTSCGCTVAKLPAQPWTLPPGSNGQIQVEVNLAGKSGFLSKQVLILASNTPPKILFLRLNLPLPQAMTEQERARNAALAQADAQAIFKGSCAICHVVPAKGRMGGDLYAMMCGVCHESPRRASMVANLHTLKKHTDFDFWKTTITYGVTNSAMPGFAISQAGPLTDAQVDSLAEYLNVYISRNPPRHSAAETVNAAKAVKAAQLPTLPRLKPLAPIKPIDPIQPPTPPVVPPVSTNWVNKAI